MTKLPSKAGMNILIIGPGAVGQVFGYHLAKAGAYVTFFVREESYAKYQTALSEGFLLQPIHKKDGNHAVIWKDFSFISQMDQIAEQNWDYVWFCIPSQAIDTSLLATFAGITGDALLILLLPEGKRTGLVSDELMHRVVWGGIAFMSWFLPLTEHDTQKSGVMYWFPPLLSCPFTSSNQVVGKKLATFMRQGGLKAAFQERDTSPLNQAITAILLALTSGLECSQWSWSDFVSSKWITIARKACGEGIALAAKRLPLSAYMLLKLVCHPVMFKPALWFAKKLFPYNLEAYIAAHYTKTHDQTMYFFQYYFAIAQEQNVHMPYLQMLYEQIG